MASSKVYEIWSNGKTYFAAAQNPDKQRAEGFEVVATTDEWNTAQLMAVLRTCDHGLVAAVQKVVQEYKAARRAQTQAIAAQVAEGARVAAHVMA